MQQTIKHYEIQYPRSAYTFPTQARAEKVEFNDTHMIIHLQDGRIVHVPLAWIPTLANATPADREKVIIGWDGQLLHYDPEDGAINEDLLVASFMRYDEPTR
jgi:hypothetical protein